MRRIPCRLPALILLATLSVLGCDPGAKTASKPPVATPSPPATGRDEIPTGRLDAVIAGHYRGLGQMERFEYGDAIREFRAVHELAPGWIPGSINLAIALLNNAGKAEAAAKAGKAVDVAVSRNFEEAEALLSAVLERDPKHLHAHFCRGLILNTMGKVEEAHRDFQAVVDADPSDAQSWLMLGSTVTNPKRPGMTAGPKQAQELIPIYLRALELNPYLVPALYKLQQAYVWAGDKKTYEETNALWKRLNPKGDVIGPGDGADTAYGELGRYATLIGPATAIDRPAGAVVPPRFGPANDLAIPLPEGHRWAKAADFEGPQAVIGRARERFGAAVATFDADGDGKADLYLTAAVVGPNGVRDALLLNRGEGRFEDASAAFGLPDDRCSLGVAAADFDADGHIDVFLTGAGGDRLLRNLGSKFEDVSKAAGLDDWRGLSLTARWLDLDQDGDLDLYVVRYAGPEHLDKALADVATPGAPNGAFRNDGKPAKVPNEPPSSWSPPAVAVGARKSQEGLSIAFIPWPDAPDLLGGDRPHTAVAVLDLDEDRDLDLVVSADDGPPRAILNDRLGRFHEADLDGVDPRAPLAGLLSADLDKDGQTDLVGAGPEVGVWARRKGLRFEPWPCDAKGWKAAILADLDLDGWPDLVGLPADAPPTPAWARNEGGRLVSRRLALGPVGEGPLVGMALADLVGDPLPDVLLLQDGRPPTLARNLGNGNRWIALDLGGRWRAGTSDRMRSNPQAIGTRVVLEGQGLRVPYDHATPEAGLAQSVGPVVLGIGKSEAVPLVRLRWPDGILQCELNVPADQKVMIAENNRRPSSCPVLFTWDGGRFTCVADFLGGGGLGYLVAPGQYGQPDRDETVAIAPGQLAPVDGVYRLAVAEPMDELSYLDRLKLVVVDRPPGVEAAPDERFAPGGHRPTGDLIAWRKAIRPAKATDLEGADLDDILRDDDRKTADGFKRLNGWIGYAEPHGIVLDFGDRLSGFGPSDPLVLCLSGWVEYAYSQTNYAASTAGVALQPPVLERRKPDGTWELLDADPGYPAGLPRMTTLDLTGKLTGPECALRLRTNMELYWDRAFLAVKEAESGVRETEVPLSRATLGYRGYTREVSPDGRPPFLYDYEHVDPAPLAGLEGRLTRYGDVADLLRSDDDQLCLVGPGDEVRLEFDAKAAPPLPEGWTRSYLLRAVGYCKDADPFTATSDTIDPLPYQGMPPYPFGPNRARPQDPSYRAYLDAYQTRPSGSR